MKYLFTQYDYHVFEKGDEIIYLPVTVFDKEGKKTFPLIDLPADKKENGGC